MPYRIVLAGFVAGSLLACRPLEAVSQESPATNPQRQAASAVTSLDVAPGLEVTLFASEPMIVNPTNMDIDERGRVWVAEGYNYRTQLNPENPVKEEGDRIVILEDTNGDGKADKQSVYYQGTDVNAALGVFVMGNRLYVSASPNLLIFTDTNGDDKPDRKEVLFTGISGEQHDHALHAVTFGPDGKLYFNYGNEGKQINDRDGNPVVDMAGNKVVADGNPYREGMVFRMNPDGSQFEVLGHNFRNNYEVTVDSYGTLWQSDNDDDGNRGVRINYVMEFGNYGFKDEVTGASWQTPRTNMEEEIPLRHWHLNDPGVVPNLLQTGAGSPTGMVLYEGRLLPEVFHDGMIHADAGPNVVRAYPVQKSGAGYTARIENIVQGARDQWFRPSDVTVAPDGSLFIADWYDPGVGGHQVGDLDRGRIFRVAPPNTPYRIQAPDLSTTAGAIEALNSPNVATRYLAWTNLHAKGADAEDALREMWESDPNPRFRARALWLLTKIPGRGDHYVRQALQDSNPDLRITGLRAARQLGVDVVPYIETAVRDSDPQVRREAAIALRHNMSPKAAELWADLAMQYDGNDRWYLEALGIAADRQWDAFFKTWKNRVGDDWNTPVGRDIVWRARTAQAIPMLSEIITDPNTSPKERPRYFRALDFHTDPSKQDALIAMLDGSHSDQPQITALALQTMDGSNLAKSPRVRTALEQTLALASGTRQFVDLVDRFGLTDRNPDLVRIALDNPNDNLGAAAARLVVENGGLPLFEEALASDNAQIVTAALNVLANVGNDEAIGLIRGVMVDETRNIAERRTAVQTFGRGWSGEERLLSVVKSGILPAELKPAAASVLFNSYRESIRTEAAAHLDAPANLDGKTLPPVYELARRSGDAAHGKQVFAGVCATCHVVNGEGTDFGPALSEIGGKLSKNALYTAILHPDAGISFGYEGTNITLQDGTQAVGYIVSETADAIELKTPGGITAQYPKAEIASRTALEHSLMPTGLERSMSEQDLVDLVEYLQTLKRAGE